MENKIKESLYSNNFTPPSFSYVRHLSEDEQKNLSDLSPYDTSFVNHPIFWDEIKALEEAVYISRSLKKTVHILKVEGGYKISYFRIKNHKVCATVNKYLWRNL